MSYEVEFVPINKIKPSPENDEVYGVINTKDFDLVNLANDIAKDNIREPLQVSKDNYIVSGHRRYAAAKLVKMASVPIVRLAISRKSHTELEWKKILRAHNHQRVKPSHVRLKEALLDIDPELAHEQLISERDERDKCAPPAIEIVGQKTRSDISDRKKEMLDACIKVVDGLRPYWPVSDRHIHYGLLNDPPWRNTSKGSQRRRYGNDRKSYGDLCNLLTRARLLGIIPWEAIADETRPVFGTWGYRKDVAAFVDLEMHSFLRGYRRDLLQSQSDHVELIVEKMTVQSIAEKVAKKFTMPMTVGRGYCSITPRHEIVQRYKQSGKDRLVLLIASDFDPDGEEIAESFAKSIRDDFGVDEVRASKILLRDDQVREWNLPDNGMEAKESSSKFEKFTKRFGKKVYELEAIAPEKMQATIQQAIESAIDLKAFNEELRAEVDDAAKIQAMKSTALEAFREIVSEE